jgi:hypothetical protein
MNAFTPGQAVRMRASWDAYRKIGQKSSAPAVSMKVDTMLLVHLCPNSSVKSTQEHLQNY